jgi:ankyrin repeat protein
MPAEDQDESEPTFPEYMTPLYLAVTGGDFARARELVHAGNAIDDQPTFDGYTLLHEAVEKGNTAAVRFLLSVGCQRALNGFDYVYRTPLMVAAAKNRLEPARLLLAAGADVDARDEANIGNTAIRIAADEGHLEMVNLLLAAGADPTIPGWMQIDAVMEARIQLEKNPGSDTRRKILAVLEAAAAKRKA